MSSAAARGARLDGDGSSLRLSVIVPVYNDQDALGRCLGALTASCPPGVEIIVVDDASTDESATVAARLASRLVRLATNAGPHLRLGLLQPEAHVHLVVHRDGGGQVLLHLLALGGAPGELAEAEVAVGEERSRTSRGCGRIRWTGRIFSMCGSLRSAGVPHRRA